MSEKVSQLGDRAVSAIQNNVGQALGLIYGLGMLTWTAFNQMNSNYWSYFLTEICGLEPTVMGTVKAVTGVGEWFFVIIAAIIIERVWLKHGQYRSWLLVAPPATFVCLLMTFVDPVFLDMGAKTAWMIFFQIVGGFFSSFFMIAATSIVPVISRTEADRTLLSQRKAQGNMLVKVLFAAISLPAILAINGLVYRVPAGENAQNAGPAGFTVLALVFGIIMIVMFVVMYKRIDGMDPTQKICEERAAAKKRGEKVPPLAAGEKVGLGEMLKYWLTNLPAVIGLFAEIIRFVAQMTIQSMAMYVFTYAFGDVAMAAVMLTACNVTGLVATFVSEPVARKVGIRATYLVGIGGVVRVLRCVPLRGRVEHDGLHRVHMRHLLRHELHERHHDGHAVQRHRLRRVARRQDRQGVHHVHVPVVPEDCQRGGRPAHRLRLGRHRVRVGHGGVARARTGHGEHHLPHPCRVLRRGVRGLLLRLPSDTEEDGADRRRPRCSRG